MKTAHIGLSVFCSCGMVSVQAHRFLKYTPHLVIISNSDDNNTHQHHVNVSL